MARLTPSEFAAKWQGSEQKESAAAQSHFNDLCEMLGVPTPIEADPKGEWYAFEKGATKTSGGEGYADVWKRGHFAWEYKGKRKDLKAAYQQLLQYREALENPPCLVVCDMDRFEVHTNFTAMPTEVHRFALSSLVREPQEPLRVLRAVMSNPEELRPARTRDDLTKDAAEHFAALAQRLRGRGHDPHRVAHFLNKILFCLFAEDAGLLPKDLLERLATGTGKDPKSFDDGLRTLFDRMAKSGGLFGPERIEWFNGGLFDDDDTLPLEPADIATVRDASTLNWSQIEPAIFGTLFERGLDPDNRTALGAHYTDRESIMQVVEPVVMVPLRREFEALKEEVTRIIGKGKRGGAATRAKNKADKALQRFLDRLAAVRVLDPACGSGNFLYMALQALKDLEREVMIWGSELLGVPLGFPRVNPAVLHGIEINDYAAELARVTIWIGEIQWMISHGFAYRTNPILQPLGNVECRDALLDLRNPTLPVEAVWPETEFIIGNPPFLGTKKLRAGLGDEYVERLFLVYGDRIPNFSDFCCYWFEKAREQIEAGKTNRAGLLATQGIRGGRNNRVLQRILETGGIFFAVPDQEWVLDGATVHVSMVGFDGGHEQTRILDGRDVTTISPELTSGVSLALARPIACNRQTAFIGDVKGGPFTVPGDVARSWLETPNPHGRPNSEVLRPWMNSLDVTRRPQDLWIVDFGVSMSLEDAAKFELPFRYVEQTVRPARERGRPTRKEWWLHMRPCPGMRAAVRGLRRFAATPSVAKHRLFVWLDGTALPDHQLVVFGRDDDYFFGVLQSNVHECWARRKGTQLREAESGCRYTPTTCFETFSLPPGSGGVRAGAVGREATDLSIVRRIEGAAQELVALRSGWLEPRDSSGAPALEGEALARRTLTNLYNDRPAWLENAHLALDRAVLAAYGWDEAWAEGLQPVRDEKGRVNPALGVRSREVEEEVLVRLLDLNLERSQEQA